MVHPPARTDWFTVDPSVEREPWLLIASALEPYKRVELAIEAANQRGWSLKVAGRGSQHAALKAIAGPTVSFLGWVDEAALRDLYRRARALLYPQVEDFGITAVEAQACGCPVVAFKAGGALDTVTSNSGVFFPAQNADALCEAIDTLDGRSIDPLACRRNAERFSQDVFDQAIVAQVREMVG